MTLSKHAIKIAAPLLALSILTLSCKSQKKVTADTTYTTQASPVSGQNNVDQAAQTQLQTLVSSVGAWKTLKTNGHLNLSGGTSFSSGMQMRMIRDQVIYISIRPLLGIEAGKLIIKGDSLFVINKVQKQYLAEKVSLLTAGIPADVRMVQDMFLGRAFIIGEGTLNKANASHMEAKTSAEGFTITPKEQPQQFSYAFTYDNKRHIRALKVKPAQGNESYSITYDDVQTTLAGLIAHTMKLETQVKGKPMNLSLSLDKISWNEELDTSFTVPTSYKRLDARSLLGIFQQ